MKKIEDLTTSLIVEIGEDPNREGLIKTPSRVAKAWEFFSLGYNQNIKTTFRSRNSKIYTR